MKTLVLGSNGQLGQALAGTTPGGANIVGLDLSELDITSAEALLAVCRKTTPAVIINAAAYTAVDKAESEPELASKVNVDGPRNIAAAAHDIGARLIHISTDFVFDGEASAPYTPDGETNPLSVYGRTKRDGEKAILEAMPEDAVVVRTAWLYSKTGGNFVKSIQIIGKTICIQGHAHPLLTKKPVMVFFALDIFSFELLRTINILPSHRLNQT